MNPIILGIDPGTTTAYAILDMHGQIVATNSAKELGLNGLIKETLTYGTPIAVGTDKAKIPDLVKDYSAQTGARVIAPAEDLPAKDKIMLSGDNAHIKDAIASAQLCFNRLHPTIHKSIEFAENNNLDSGKVIELVIKHGLSRNAALLLLRPETKTDEIVKNAVETRLRKEDFVLLYNELASAKKTIKMLLDKTRPPRPLIVLKKSREKADKQQIYSLRQQNGHIQHTLNEVERKKREYINIIENLDGKTLLRLVKNLTNAPKKPLLVDTPAEFSPKEEYEQLIIYKGNIPKNFLNKPNFIRIEDVFVKEYGEYALVDNKSIQQARSKKEILKNVIAEYKEQRT